MIAGRGVWGRLSAVPAYAVILFAAGFGLIGGVLGTLLDESSPRVIPMLLGTPEFWVLAAFASGLAARKVSVGIAAALTLLLVSIYAFYGSYVLFVAPRLSFMSESFLFVPWTIVSLPVGVIAGAASVYSRREGPIAGACAALPLASVLGETSLTAAADVDYWIMSALTLCFAIVLTRFTRWRENLASFTVATTLGALFYGLAIPWIIQSSGIFTPEG